MTDLYNVSQVTLLLDLTATASASRVPVPRLYHLSQQPLLASWPSQQSASQEDVARRELRFADGCAPECHACRIFSGCCAVPGVLSILCSLAFRAPDGLF